MSRTEIRPPRLLSTPFEIDLAAFPVVWVTFPEGATLAQVDRHFQNLEAVYRELGAFVLVADINRVHVTENTAQQRARMAEGSDHLAALGAYRGEIVVAESAVIRGLVTAYSWMRRNRDYPFACVASRGEAVAWSSQLLGGKT